MFEQKQMLKKQSKLDDNVVLELLFMQVPLRETKVKGPWTMKVEISYSLSSRRVAFRIDPDAVCTVMLVW